MTSRAGAGRRRKRLIFASICHADASRPRRISATLSWVRPSLTGTWPTRHSPRISNVPAQARARASRPIWARSRQGSRRRPSSNHRSRQRRERSALRAAPAMPARRRLPIRRPAPPGRLRYRRGRRRSDSGAVRFVCRRVARRAAPGPGRAHRPGRPPGRWPSAAAPALRRARARPAAARRPVARPAARRARTARRRAPPAALEPAPGKAAAFADGPCPSLSPGCAVVAGSAGRGRPGCRRRGSPPCRRSPASCHRSAGRPT